MNGQVDLSLETQNLNVKVIPQLGDSASTVVGLLHPLAGVATLIAGRLMKNPLGKAFAFDYSISGTWSEPKVEKPDQRAAEIARKAKAEEERKKREQAAREKKEREKKEADQREAEKKKDREKKEADQREAEKRKQEEQRRVAEARERQAREAEALKAQAEREQAAREAQQKAQAEATARARAEADYIRRIQTKVKDNVILPPDLTGNPEAIFDVVQLPTGEIIDAVLKKSSGVRAYDDAVQRAIVKSSPLPRPDRPDLFQRTLTLKFRPQD